jgi:hypothetical protein
VEATSESLPTTLGSSSTDMVSRSGEDIERLLVGECWLRLAPRRLRVGVGDSDTSVSFSVVVSVTSSDTMVLAGSSATVVSIFISWLLRRLLLRRLPLPPLRGRCSSAGSSLDSVDAVTSDASALGGSSKVEIESLVFGRRGESFSTNGSGVP